MIEAIDEAERQWAQARTLFADSAPEILSLAATVNNIGLLAMDRGDYMTAQAGIERGPAPADPAQSGQRRRPGSMNNLAVIDQLRGDWELAEPLLRQSLALKERHAPDSLTLASTLTTLSIVVREQGQVDEAERLSLRALVIVDKVAPNHPSRAGSLVSLEHIALGARSAARSRDRVDQAAAFLARRGA